MTKLLSQFTHGGMAFGNAIAENIEEGKTALVQGVEITGTKAADSGILLLVVNPTGITDTSYNPSSEHGAVIISNPSLGTVSSPVTTWDLDTNGYAQDTTSFATFILIDSAPAYTTRRKYEMWGKTKDAALTDLLGVRIQLNIVNISTDYWYVQLRWINASGVFRLEIREFTASVDTQRATVDFTTALDVPAIWNLIVYEQGDAVIAQCTMYEGDAITDDEAVSCAYTVGSRPHKSATMTRFRTQSTAGDEWLIRGCMVSDML